MSAVENTADDLIVIGRGRAHRRRCGGRLHRMFSPSIGFAVFCGYAAVAITAGLVLFLRRDA